MITEYLTLTNTFILSLVIVTHPWYIFIKEEKQKYASNLDWFYIVVTVIFIVLSVPIAVVVLFYYPYYLFRVLKAKYYMKKKKD